MAQKTLRDYFKQVSTPPHGWDGQQRFTTSSGHDIRYGYAPATVDEPIGTVVLTHGYDEDIDLCYETIRGYQDRGYEVFAMDWHGFGQSGRDYQSPDRSMPSSEGFSGLVDDFADFMTDIVEPNKQTDGRMILSTNSMGGHISLLYLHDNPDVFDAAVMSTPMFDITRLGLPKQCRAISDFVARQSAKYGFRDLSLAVRDDVYEKAQEARLAANTGYHKLCEGINYVGKLLGREDDAIEIPEANMRNIAINLLKSKNPEARVRLPTVGWLSKAYETITPSTQPQYLSEVSTPIIIGSSGKDGLVDNSAHDDAHKYLQQSRLFKYQNGDHTLWNNDDVILDQWWADVDQSLDDIFNGPGLSPDKKPGLAGTFDREAGNDNLANGLAAVEKVLDKIDVSAVQERVGKWYRANFR